jgi:hypothetical protein
MKSKKGKADASDSEGTHQDEVEDKDNVASEPESAASEDAKVSKRKSKHGKKKGNNAASEDGGDGGTESKRRKQNVPVVEKAEAVEYEVGKCNGHFCTKIVHNSVHILYPKKLVKGVRYS